MVLFFFSFFFLLWTWLCYSWSPGQRLTESTVKSWLLLHNDVAEAPRPILSQYVYAIGILAGLCDLQITSHLLWCTVARHLHPLLLLVDEYRHNEEDDDGEEKTCQDPGCWLVDEGHLCLAGVILAQTWLIWGTRKTVFFNQQVSVVHHHHDKSETFERVWWDLFHLYQQGWGEQWRWWSTLRSSQKLWPSSWGRRWTPSPAQRLLFLSEHQHYLLPVSL